MEEEFRPLCSSSLDWASGAERLPPYRNTTFWNFDKTLQFEMMRLPPHAASCVTMLIKFVYKKKEEALPLVNSGFISRDDFEADDAQYTSIHAEYRASVVSDGILSRRQVNEIHGITVCGCGLYVRAANEPACAMCHLTGVVRRSVPETCPVCLDTGLSWHMPPTTCCGKSVHASCLARCGNRCPLCRAEQPLPQP